MRDERSAIWGGATLGLFVGLILGFFVGTYWTTVLYAVVIGAASGVVGNILGWIGDRARDRAAAKPPSASDSVRTILLKQAEGVLAQASPADFETTQNGASTCVAAVANLVNLEAWRMGYASFDAFYAAHETRHPDIRLYAATWRELEVDDPNDPPNGTGALIVERIASHRARTAT